MATKIEIGQGRRSKSICRLCFMEREHYQSIFEADHADLAEWIRNLTSLKLVNVPNAPASLCLECKSTLEDFESFREMCHTNDRVFQEMFFQNDGHAKETPDPLDSPTEKAIKVERSEIQEKEISNGECGIASIDPEVDNNDITEEFEDIKIEIVENPPDCEEKTDAKTNKPIKSKKKPKKDQPVQCEVCSKSFTTRVKLRYHMRYHNKKQFCSYCNKAFKSSTDLKSHIRAHTGEKPFKCEKCEISYKKKKSLNTHLLSFHKHRTDRQYSFSCEVCNLKFSTPDDLDHHKRVICSAPTLIIR